MVVFPSAKNDEDPIRNEGARLLTTLNINFPNTQGQLTLQTLMGSSRISNSSETLGCSCYCKNDETPIKNEGASVLTKLNIRFSNTPWKPEF